MINIVLRILVLATTLSLLLTSCSKKDGPVVDIFSPDFGPSETLITVEGEGFEDLVAINFDDGVAADFNPSFGTATALLMRVPPNAPLGDNMIHIITEHGETFFPFRVTLQAPSVFDFAPKSANEGAIISITGKNFFEPLEVLFFDSIPGNIVYHQPDSIAVEVPANVQRGRIKVKANGGESITPELFFSTTELLVNDFDGNGVRSETNNWLFYGDIDQNANTAVSNTSPSPLEGNYLKLSGLDSGGIWIGGTESHSNDLNTFDVFDIVSDIDNTFVEFDINNNGRNDTHLIVVLAERNGSINDFSRTFHIQDEGWHKIQEPLNRFLDINGATLNPQKIRTIKLHLYNELSSSQTLEVNVDNLKFIQVN